MLISRYNLLIHRMTKQDKGIPMLDNVHFEGDGTSIATNGLAVVTVSPVQEKMREQVILEDKSDSSDITISSESVKEVLKSLPKDTKYSGILEHCIIENTGSGKAKFRLSDGKRKRSIEIKTYDNEYIGYNKVLQKSYQDNENNVKTAVNLSRLLSVLSTISECCPDTSYQTPVFMEYNSDGNIIFRATNQKNGQQIIAVMKSYHGSEGKIPKLSEWERKMFYGESIDNSDSNNRSVHVHDVKTRKIAKKHRRRDGSGILVRSIPKIKKVRRKG